jgi:uncharacterized membrane protein
MVASIESLSLTSGAFLIAIVSAGIVWLLYVVGPKDLREVWVVVVPFGLAYCLYWAPVWFAQGSEYERALIKSEYRNWQFLFIIAWFLAGAIPSAAIVSLLRNRRAR